MPRANAPTRSLDEITVGELRAVLAGGNETATIADALADITEANRISAAHELDVRQYNAYLDRRTARHAAAIADAAGKADKANRGHHDGARMAARQEARLEADELFARRSPNLDFREWIERDRPDVHEVEVGVIRRAVEHMTDLVR